MQNSGPEALGGMGSAGGFGASGRRPGRGFDHEDPQRAYLVSVNGRGGASFKDNEGFYEFDLKMK